MSDKQNDLQNSKVVEDRISLKSAASQALSDDYIYRFSGLERLYGTGSLEKLSQSHVCVVGLGGVGSWAVEALVRSGVGQLTLMDFDDVCVSNFNRQVHSVEGQVGRMKTQSLKDRALSINPEVRVNLIEEPLDKANVEELLAHNFDFIVDAIDDLRAKCELISRCYFNKQPVLAVGGAGGKSQAGKIEVDDLNRTHGDPLLRNLRRELRHNYGLPKDSKKKLKIPCVYSAEPMVFPGEDGEVCTERPKDILKPLDCSQGLGTAMHVTATFGILAANYVIDHLVKK